MPTNTPPRRPTSRWLVRSAAVAGGFGLVALTGLLAGLYALQARMIFPGARSQGTPEAAVAPRDGVELLTLTTSRGDRVAAAFGAALTPDGRPHPDAANRPTLLYFYGNGYNLRAAAESDLDPFRRLGLNVLIPEYVGYGLSTGRAGERGCYETADAAYDYLRTRPDVDPSRVVAVGRSLGGAVAIDLASRRKVAGLVAFCTFTRMGDMVARRFPFVPSDLLLRHRFESLAKVARVSCPILLGHGGADTFVPASMSESLASAAAGPVTAFTVAGADHNDFYEVGGRQIGDAVSRFVRRLETGGPTPAR